MDKLSEWVSPLEVVDGGSKGLHGVTSGVRYDGAPSDGLNGFNSSPSLRADSLDAGLVVWSSPDPFPSPIHKDPDLAEGASFMLWDNIWNTKSTALRFERSRAVSPTVRPRRSSPSFVPAVRRRRSSPSFAPVVRARRSSPSFAPASFSREEEPLVDQRAFASRSRSYINWFPFVKEDANLLFRFRLTIA